MPKCRRCGNGLSFGARAVPPAADTANGPNSGLWADFDENGTLIELMGNTDNSEIWDRVNDDPKAYLNICMNCGSSDIEW